MNSSFETVATDEGVYYTDARAQAAALAWFDDFNFSLPKLDAFIVEAAPADQRERLTDFRRRAIDAHSAGNDDVVLPWLLFFFEVTRSFAWEAALRPVAFKAVLRTRKEAARRLLGADAVRKYTETDRDRWRAVYAAELQDRSMADAARVIARREGKPMSAERSIRAALAHKQKVGKPLGMPNAK